MDGFQGLGDEGHITLINVDWACIRTAMGFGGVHPRAQMVPQLVEQYMCQATPKACVLVASNSV